MLKNTVIPESFYLPEQRKVMAANFRHDVEHGEVKSFSQTRVLPAWQREKYMMGRRLSDRRIAFYQKTGILTS